MRTIRRCLHVKKAAHHSRLQDQLQFKEQIFLLQENPAYEHQHLSHPFQDRNTRLGRSKPRSDSSHSKFLSSNHVSRNSQLLSSREQDTSSQRLQPEQRLTTTHPLSNPFRAGPTNWQSIRSSSKHLSKPLVPPLTPSPPSILSICQQGTSHSRLRTYS